MNDCRRKRLEYVRMKSRLTLSSEFALDSMETQVIPQTRNITVLPATFVDKAHTLWLQTLLHCWDHEYLMNNWLIGLFCRDHEHSCSIQNTSICTEHKPVQPPQEGKQFLSVVDIFEPPSEQPAPSSLQKLHAEDSKLFTRYIHVPEAIKTAFLHAN